MGWVKLVLETVTPCFIGGAKGGAIRRDWKEFACGHYPDDWQEYQRLEQDKRALNFQRDRDEIKKLDWRMRDIKQRISSAERQTREQDCLAQELLRPPSFIGIWRFWFRTFGGTQPGREAFLFGDTEHGQGIVQVRPGLQGIADDDVVYLCDEFSDLEALDPQCTQQFHYQDRYNKPKTINPLVYLGYGPVHNEEDLERPAIRAGCRFEIEVAVVPRRHQNSEDRQKEELQGWRDLRHTLWLWQTFGGLGARSRRGWGSIQIVEVDTTAIPEPEKQTWETWFSFPAKGSELATGVHQHLQEILNQQNLTCQSRTVRTASVDIAAAGVTNRTGEADFSNFSAFCAVFPSYHAQTWGNALGYLGKKMLEMRSNADPDDRPPQELRVKDHDGVWRDLQNNTATHAPYRAAFGLPHNYRFSNGQDASYTADVEVHGKRQDATRRASPVLFHVVKLSDNSFAPIVLWFKAKLTSGQIEMTSNRARGRIDPLLAPPDWSAVVEFLKSLV